MKPLPAIAGAPKRERPPGLVIWLRLFWMFMRINLLTSSGPASVGLLYQDAVGSIMNEAQFVEAVGFSNVLPGSEALKLAMFVGFSAGGMPGILAALLGSAIPPVGSMLLVTLAVQQFQEAPWMTGFVRGMLPAVAMLISVAAWKLLRGGTRLHWRPVVIAVVGLLALLLGAPAPSMLVGAGLAGIFLFR